MCFPCDLRAETSPDLEEVAAPGGCPRLKHYPLITIPRGTPAPVAVVVECPNNSIASVKIFVRMTEAGKPVSLDMHSAGGNSYEGQVPASMIAGIPRFWYYIDARSGDGEVAQTRWNPVQIVDPVGGEAGAGSELGSKRAGWWWWGAGALLLGGTAYAIYDHNDNGGGGGNTNINTNTNGDTNPRPPGRNGGGFCILTGNESAVLEPSYPYSEEPLFIRVCGTCDGADISASATWGAEDSKSNYQNDGCSEGTYALSLDKPNFRRRSIRGVKGEESEHQVFVYSNNRNIATFNYPRDEDFDLGR